MIDVIMILIEFGNELKNDDERSNYYSDSWAMPARLHVINNMMLYNDNINSLDWDDNNA